MKNKYFPFVILGLLIIVFGIYFLSNNNRSNNNIVLDNNQDNNQGEKNNNNQEEDFKDGVYIVNGQESVLNWEAEKVLSGHTGTVQVESGRFVIEENKITSGEVVVNMTTIESDENLDNLVDHLKSDDFFNVSTYQESRLTINSVEESDSPNTYLATGNMKIKGIDNEIEFPIRLSKTNDNIVIESDFSIDRTRWDINYRSGKFFQDLGDNMIKDKIDLNVIIEGSIGE